MSLPVLGKTITSQNSRHVIAFTPHPQLGAMGQAHDITTTIRRRMAFPSPVRPGYDTAEESDDRAVQTLREVLRREAAV